MATSIYFHFLSLQNIHSYIYIWKYVNHSVVSREFSWLRDQIWVSHIAGRFFTIWATKEAYIYIERERACARARERGCVLIWHISPHLYMGFLGGSDGKESAWNTGDPGSISRSGRSSAEGNGYPLQYYTLENSMDRGDWWATIYGITKSQTWLSD